MFCDPAVALEHPHQIALRSARRRSLTFVCVALTSSRSGQTCAGKRARRPQASAALVGLSSRPAQPTAAAPKRREAEPPGPTSSAAPACTQRSLVVIGARGHSVHCLGRSGGPARPGRPPSWSRPPPRPALGRACGSAGESGSRVPAA